MQLSNKKRDESLIEQDIYSIVRGTFLRTLQKENLQYLLCYPKLNEYELWSDSSKTFDEKGFGTFYV